MEAHFELLIPIFAVIVIFFLGVDLFYNKNAHKVSIKEALIWTLVWVTAAIGFAGVIGLVFDPITLSTPLPNGKPNILDGWDISMLYLTAYLIEKTLSVDNLFVFIMIFSFFKLDQKYHHKVLLYGILGAIVLRMLFIFGGMGIISLTTIDINSTTTINWLLSLFALMLIYFGYKTIFKHDADEDTDFNKNFGVRLIKKFIPIVPRYDGGNFFTIENGKKYGTMLLLVVAAIEASDVIFAVDSIPACFAVMPPELVNEHVFIASFILYASNIFAILGLRQLYFLLDAVKDMFKYLPIGIGIVLAFIGVKMLIAPWFHMPAVYSLITVMLVLIGSIGVSVIKK